MLIGNNSNKQLLDVIMKDIKYILLLLMIVQFYGCATVPEQETVRTLILDGVQLKESKPDEFISWECGDSSYGRTLVEVGYLTVSDDYDYMQVSLLKDIEAIFLQFDNENADWYTQLDGSEKKVVDTEINKLFHDKYKSKLGFVLYDGTNTGDLVIYRRDGLTHRWDWGTASHTYSFVIATDGTGLYYDFSTADDDGIKSEANNVYKCSRR